PVDQVDPAGIQSQIPHYVPAVCGVQTWSTNTTGDAGMSVSVAARPDGATVLAAPSAGGSLTGFVLDTRMNMVSSNKLAIDGSFTQVVASFVGDRLVSTAIDSGAVYLHLLDADLGNPQYTAKIPGTYLADPAFYQTQADLVMPVAGDDGLWLHRFADSFEPLDSKLVVATKPARSMAAAQMGVAMLAAWSTDTECYMMLTSTFSAGINTRVPVACPDPRLSVNQQTGEAIMVFDSVEGVRMMSIQGTQFGGDARVLRSASTSPRTLFDGNNFWVSYLDTRGDLIVGFLDGKRQLVTMSLAGPKPEEQAYEFVMVDGHPWVFSMGTDGYSAYRMCIDAQW
ncbi:MAG TPA: hypothetical protein VIV40_39925, partial [Kofleriaceae bacterium]